MTEELIKQKYLQKFDLLKELIKQTEGRVLQEEPDPLFFDNINFFIKTFLISACTYLEAYLQEIAFYFSSEINERLRIAKVPHNVLCWRFGKDLKDKDLKFRFSDLEINKKEISDNLSPNPYKTIELFKLLGINVVKEEFFIKNKDIVGSIVDKRNKIIHHDDDASDVSFLDLCIFIDSFIDYIEGFSDLISRNLK